MARLKVEDGRAIQVDGSAGLIQKLLERDLVDELRNRVFPLVPGGRERLFRAAPCPPG